MNSSIRRKVVVFCSNTSWYLFNFRKNTLITFVNAGYDVYCVSPKDSYTEKLLSIGIKWIDIKIDRNSINPVNDIFVICNYMKIYWHLKPFAIFNFTPKPNIYSSLAGRLFTNKIINNIAGLGTLYQKGGSLRTRLIATIATLMYRISQGVVSHIFFQNEDDKVFFEKKRIAPSAIHSILPGSGVDLKRFNLQNSASPTSENGDITFLMCARLLEEKGVRIYAESAKKVKAIYPSSRFLLVGPMEEGRRNGIKSTDIAIWQEMNAIDYLGEKDDIVPIFIAASCIVLPTYYGEGVPKTLIEGAALGKPLIATNLAGCVRVVKDGENGYVVNVKSVGELTKAMLDFCALSPQEKNRMGEASRDIAVRLFDEQQVIDAYVKTIA